MNLLQWFLCLWRGHTWRVPTIALFDTDRLHIFKGTCRHCGATTSRNGAQWRSGEVLDKATTNFLERRGP